MCIRCARRHASAAACAVSVVERARRPAGRSSMSTVITVRRGTVISCDVVTPVRRWAGGVRAWNVGGSPFMLTVSQSVGSGRAWPYDRRLVVPLAARAPVVDRHNLRHGRSTGVPRNRYRRRHVYRAVAASPTPSFCYRLHRIIYLFFFYFVTKSIVFAKSHLFFFTCPYINLTLPI